MSENDKTKEPWRKDYEWSCPGCTKLSKTVVDLDERLRKIEGKHPVVMSCSRENNKLVR